MMLGKVALSFRLSPIEALHLKRGLGLIVTLAEVALGFPYSLFFLCLLFLNTE